MWLDQREVERRTHDGGCVIGRAGLCNSITFRKERGMEQRTQPVPWVTPFAAGALGRLGFVAAALLVLWAAIGWVLGWWG
jgi:hypothetical protein